MEIDIASVVDKLVAAGKAERTEGGYEGDFSLKHDAHLLTEEELKIWIYALHQGTHHSDKKCHDVHRWKITIINEDTEAQA